MNYCRNFLILLLLFSSVIYTGCGSKYVVSTISPKWDPVKIEKIAAVPFAFAPMGGEYGLRSAKVDPHGAALVTGMFLRGTEGLGYTIIPFDDEAKERLSPQGTLPIDKPGEVLRGNGLSRLRSAFSAAVSGDTGCAPRIQSLEPIVEGLT